MPPDNPFSRRDFLKTAALGSGALFGSSLLQTCSDKEVMHACPPDSYPVFQGLDFDPQTEVAGILFSQIGYELGKPVKIVIRLPRQALLSSKAYCRLIAVNREKSHQATCTYWGKLWGSHWWIATFDTITEAGTWNPELVDNGEVLIRDRGLEVREGILWDETSVLASVDILERRRHFTGLNAGWQDAGTLWVESCAQSAMIMGLEDLLEKADKRLDDDFRQRIHEQIVIGCDYLVMTREKAEELGYPAGAMSHDLFGHEKDILPNDASKAVVALMRAVRLLPKQYREKIQSYKHTADLTYDWLLNTAQPMADYGFSYSQRGLPENTQIPGDEFQTRDLVMMCWGALEKWKADKGKSKADCIRLAREVMSRQIPKSASEHGYYGHFYEYESLKHSEKSWAHGIVNGQFGADLGAIFPNYLVPIVEMLQLWPDHEDASRWKQTLHDFAFGYLIPACEKSPFKIVPLGIFGDEGPIWFAGPFHGTNTIYGYTAALALELAKVLDDNRLNDIAYANLLWLAGLNAGITKQNLKAAVIYSADLPDGTALPVSMMCRVGAKWAGTWFSTRGVICNGFSTGEQFKMDVEPITKNDAPSSFTDEDWIPHSAAWLSGLVRL